MVLQSLDDVVHQHLMVSTRADKSPGSKIVVANGGNGAKAEKKRRESEDSIMPLPRRSSARIQALQKAEELFARKRVEGVEEKDNCDDNLTPEKVKVKKRNRKSSGSEESVVVEVEFVSPAKKKRVAYRKCKVVGEMNGNGKGEELSGNGKVRKVNAKEELENAGGGLGEKSDLLKVKETIRLFTKHYLQLVQEEEKRCGKAEAERKVAKKASKKASKLKKGAPTEESKSTAKRPDLKAISKMMENNEILYPEKRIGNIPGIEVGYQFYSRAEMVAVGFHSHWLNGIDYMGQSYAKACSYELPVAVAIVISGMYEDDLDNAEDVVYTGQGGHNLTGDKRQIRDQKLERGNLALKNCAEQCVPVRVIRGHESSSSYTGKVYTYDGLYKVVNYWAEKGISGFTVYKFRLRRLEGQPTLTTNQVYFTYGRVPQTLTEIRGLVCEDITGGQEDMPIPATNLVDDPPVPPTGFTYCKSVKVAKNVKLPMNATGCECKGICNDPTTCACALRNGSDFPYVSRDGGRLVEAKDVVFECGPECGCGPGCVNRTSQRGLRYRLEVFRTAKKGWAVRSWDFIPSGAPVCEYTGILARAEDMDSVLENNYIFEIDCLQTIKGLGGRERRSQDGDIPANLLDKYHDQCSESAPEFCIDAGSTGNIARFINHCCEPNLFVQCVLSTHNDLRLARVMLFAADNIPPLQELTYDYGYVLDSVLDSDGKIKQMPCYCGASVCRKRLF
ncbi:histone-lysine N-methyltransferase, H3 lysine-9 specific SUVH4-like [Glycine soja]|uniref:histone-lysine N-methyltransferase, H3 lysine-9 specific SUVH4-like n=1 Tax=Glycine soja TaxID=3848 RepID=UPI00103E531F|nr:histone-lysine N-methyltransferase, H3 lysine-9 specific SUVH4-like [Glycine soja]XP_028216350.1 histone-lysine N-methyltransferase, H3 lysine-9 specific SUVH4-like [Glycine soja]